MNNQNDNILIKGRYRVIKEIGKGAFGKVYEVEDTLESNSPHLAVKRLNKDEILKNDYLQQAFFKELEAMRECLCDNSVKYIEHVISSNNLNIVMELCDDDLDRWVNNYKGFVPEPLVKEILLGLNNVFAIMNEKKILHRDLKLKNIMLKYINKQNFTDNLNFIPKLCDFGFSKMLEEDDMTRTKLGTPATMAPEVLQGKEYTYKCDIWSLGVIIYQILFKQLPFRARNEVEMVNLIIKSNGCFKVPEGATLSNDLHDLLTQMLTVDPNKRISWIEYFAHPFFFESLDLAFDQFMAKYSFNKTIYEIPGYCLKKVKSKKTNENFILKEVAKKHIDIDQERKKSLLREIDLSIKLSGVCNGFLKFIESFETKNYYLLVYENFEGSLLEDQISSLTSKQFNEDLLCKFIRSILNGLIAISKQDVVLGSLTGRSFFVASCMGDDKLEFETKICDFGLLNLFSPPTYEREYDLGEVSISQEKIVLALGLLFYKLVFGKPLFQSGNYDASKQINLIFI